MSTVKSIPWMPERAWTTARAKAAISGLTRSGFTPEHVQQDPPCEGPYTPPPPESPPVFVADLPNTPYTPEVGNQFLLEDFLSSNDDRATYWECWYWNQSAGAYWLVASGADPLSILVPVDCLWYNASPADFTVITRAWLTEPPGAPGDPTGCCAESSGVMQWDEGACPGGQPVNTGPEFQDLKPTCPEGEDVMPRYYVWAERPRTPDFKGGEQPIDWTRSDESGSL